LSALTQRLWLQLAKEIGAEGGIAHRMSLISNKMSRKEKEKRMVRHETVVNA
jgi:hypothetical protein